jgi:hypothetical protein
MNNYVIGAAMIAATGFLVWCGSAHSQEMPSVSMPTDAMGFLCQKAESVHAFLDRLEPDTDFDQAKLIGKDNSCVYMETAGIVKSNEERFTNKLGDTFAVIAITAEDKVYFTWLLLKKATAS